MCSADTSNQNKGKKSEDVFQSCSVDINDYVFAHHCFMTGEYCSKQLNVQREREKLHRNGEINAFVIMSFTDMTDVVYKWRLRSYIESLTEFLFFNSGEKETEAEMMRDFYEKSSTQQEDETPWHLLGEAKRKKNYKLYINYLNILTENKDEEDGKKAGREAYQKMSSLRCYSSDEVHRRVFYDELKKGIYHPELKVKRINVIRADSNPSSNFVICNRVCQQMQIADLVVVDVSDENTNVFYEMGMAVAMGKMILPICYSDSYFTLKLPQKVEEEKKEYLKRLRNIEASHINDKAEYDDFVLSLEHHIDCFPWQRQLFEHFGLKYRDIGRNEALEKENKKDQEKGNEHSWYFQFERAADKRFGFSDQKYDCRPYFDFQTDIDRPQKETIGKKIYRKLHRSFNRSCMENDTLVLYNMDKFLNEKEGGQCIVNYYKAFVETLRKESCFCGDRVGILVQPTAIAESVKDSDDRRHLIYNIGEIIQIGMNQATYLAHRELIKPNCFLSELTTAINTVTGRDGSQSISDQNNKSDPDQELYNAELTEWAQDVLRFTKEYIRNRSFAIYPNDPVYVDRVVENGVQYDLLESCCADPALNPYFCLYHIMLNNLKYVNEVVVDISTNSVQSLFWLGVAHGSGVNAISIRHDMNQDEEKNLAEAIVERKLRIPSEKARKIFDISGLWTAVLHANDTERFYRQLALAQLGIEQRSKLMIHDVNYFNDEVISLFWETEEATEKNINKKSINLMYEEKKKREEMLMESYYRSHFWRPMLRQNQLQIYSCAIASESTAHETRMYAEKWDLNAVSAFSYYLSKRKMIGEYEINIDDHNMETSDQKGYDLSINSKNFICVGSDASPFSAGISISRYLSEKFCIFPDLYRHCVYFSRSSNFPCILKGFKNSSDQELTPHALKRSITCNSCSYRVHNGLLHSPNNKSVSTCTQIEAANNHCEIRDNGKHEQIAQLLLWREDVSSVKGGKDYVFRASIAGSSGPATYALATLFVDEDQKESAFGKKFDDNNSKNINEECYPLLFLQREVRKEMITRYEEQLKTMLDGMLEKRIQNKDKEEDSNQEGKRRTHYITRITTVTKAYLSTVLYRYFFPFLSPEDEKQIINGLKLYVRSMMAKELSPFKLNYKKEDHMYFSKTMDNDIVKESAKCAECVLENILSELRLLEVFYRVDVSFKENVDDETMDSRQIHSIILEKEDQSGSGTEEFNHFRIRCVFYNNAEKS